MPCSWEHLAKYFNSELAELTHHTALVGRNIFNNLRKLRCLLLKPAVWCTTETVAQISTLKFFYEGGNGNFVFLQNGFTPLHVACKKNREQVIQLLLKYGANVHSANEVSVPLEVNIKKMTWSSSFLSIPFFLSENYIFRFFFGLET